MLALCATSQTHTEPWGHYQMGTFRFKSVWHPNESLPTNAFQNHITRIGLECKPTSNDDKEAEVDEMLTPPPNEDSWSEREC